MVFLRNQRKANKPSLHWMLLSFSLLLSAYKQKLKGWISPKFEIKRTTMMETKHLPLSLLWPRCLFVSSAFQLTIVSQNYAKLSNLACLAQLWGVQLPFKFQLFFEDILDRIQNRNLLSEVQDDNFTMILLRGKLNSLKLEVRAFIAYLML